MTHEHKHGENCDHEHEPAETPPQPSLMDKPTADMTKDEIEQLRQELKAQVEELWSKGTWVVAAAQSGGRYLGCVKTLRWPGGIKEDPTKADILEHYPFYLTMEPVFEYVIQLQPNEQMPGVMSKVPLIFPIDMTGHQTPICIDKPNLLFLEDLQEEDKDTYKGLVSNGILITRKATIMSGPMAAARSNGGPRIITPEQAAVELEQARRAGIPMRSGMPHMRHGR